MGGKNCGVMYDLEAGMICGDLCDCLERYGEGGTVTTPGRLEFRLVLHCRVLRTRVVMMRVCLS